MSDVNADALENNRRDLGVAAARAVAGLIPWLGPFVAEIINSLIPNQRLDRISKFAQYLEERLSRLEKDAVDRRLQQEDVVDLVEDGFFQAARARTDDRKKAIAHLLARGISDDEAKVLSYRHVLSVFGQLDDVQVVHLHYFGLEGNLSSQREFYERHRDTLSTDAPVIGASPEVIDGSTIFASERDEMVRLGVLRRNFKKPKSGELPDFDDKTGMMKASGYRITSLGRLILRYTELVEATSE